LAKRVLLRVNRPRLLWASLLLAIAVTLTVYLRSFPRPIVSSPSPASPAVLPVFGTVPDFTLTDQTGRPFNGRRLFGSVWIADFIFTSCAGACPQMTAQMAGLQQELPPDIRLVSVTVDPARDTPRRLAQYAARYSADSSRWYFLTGSKQAVGSLIRQGFLLGAAPGEAPSEPIMHSQRFVLVDREGKIRGCYDSSEETALARLRQDARAL
jgi:cytochrome oxidase Cu insertion factor (SCO1/SenC/PrrC family)